MKRQTVKDKELQKATKAKDKAEQKAKQKHDKELYNKLESSILQILPIKCAVDDGDTGFEYVDNQGFVNIYRIETWDYRSASDEELTEHIFIWDRFFRTNEGDVKFVCVNLPIDLNEQVQYFNRKKERTNNPSYVDILKENIEELTDGFRDREAKEFYLFAFEQTYENMVNTNSRIRTGLVGERLVYEIPYEQKVTVLAKYLNPYNLNVKENG